MSDIEARIRALPPEKRALLEKLLGERQAGVAQEFPRPDFEPPATPVEQILAQTWELVLGVDRVGLQDSFLALGGDSIQCVQIVARARRAGLDLNNRLVFEYPVLADLAAQVRPLPAFSEPQEPAVGDVLLTSIQHWFFSLRLKNRAHWNQSVLLDVPFPVERRHWQEALDALATHHDALRLRFVPDGGGYRQHYGEIGPVPFDLIDLTLGPESDVDQRLADEGARLQASLDLAEGPTFRGAVFRLGSERPDRLLLIAHHLTVDGLSFRILIEDLQRALDQLAAGRPIRLPLKTASFQKWSQSCIERANDPEILSRATFWRSILPPEPLPRDFERGPNSEESAEAITIELDPLTTEGLLLEASRRKTSMQTLLLAALLEAWRPWSGDAMLLDLEGHGRDFAVDGLDVSRTVGWFTALYPLRIEAGPSLEATIDFVAQALAIERSGAEYGALRYLASPERLEQLLAPLAPEVLFNYLGRFGDLEAGTAFRLVDEAPAGLFDPKGERAHVLQLFGGVFAQRLRFHCIYSRNLHRSETIRELLARFERRLRELPREAGSAARPGFSIEPGFSDEDLQRIRALAGENR